MQSRTDRDHPEINEIYDPSLLDLVCDADGMHRQTIFVDEKLLAATNPDFETEIRLFKTLGPTCKFFKHAVPAYQPAEIIAA